MQEILEFILKHLVPADVSFSVNKEETEEGITFVVSIPEEFRGKLIGKAGKNIKAIRDVLSIKARQENRRVNIRIAD